MYVNLNLEWIKNGYRAYADQVDANPIGGFAPIWVESDLASMGVSSSLQIDGLFETKSEESANQVTETVGACRTFAKNMISMWSLQNVARKGNDGEAARSLAALVNQLLTDLKISNDGNRVKIESSGLDKKRAEIATGLLPMIVAARLGAARSQDLNNVRQISLALLNYQSAHGQFPAATVLGPDGKTVHSWRVAILPFLEQPQLYEKYRQNEPWDSPHNQLILNQMPTVFLSSLGGKPNETLIQVFSGPGSIFDGTKETKISDIHDGISKTLLVTQGANSVPWTKPVDIAFDVNGEAPKLSGRHSGGAITSFADCASRLILNTIDTDDLKALVTARGGEQVDFDKAFAMPSK